MQLYLIASCTGCLPHLPVCPQLLQSGLADRLTMGQPCMPVCPQQSRLRLSARQTGASPTSQCNDGSHSWALQTAAMETGPHTGESEPTDVQPQHIKGSAHMFKVLNGKNLQSRILYMARLWLRTEGEIKELPRQTEAKEVCQKQTSLTKMLKGLLYTKKKRP